MTHIELCNKALEIIDSDAPLAWPAPVVEEGDPEFTELLALRIALELLPKLGCVMGVAPT